MAGTVKYFSDVPVMLDKFYFYPHFYRLFVHVIFFDASFFGSSLPGERVLNKIILKGVMLSSFI